MPNKPKDYSKGKIYVVRNTINDKLYYGSTCSPLHKRWYSHKEALNNKVKKDRPLYKAMNELGFENFYIEFVEDFPCKSQPELEAREGYYIRKFNTYKEGYNVLVAGRSSKQRYEDDKEVILAKNKEYREKNKTKVYEKTKEWASQNKDKVLKNKAKYRETHREELNAKVQCECGAVVRKSGIASHRKTKKHLDYINKK